MIDGLIGGWRVKAVRIPGRRYAVAASPPTTRPLPEIRLHADSRFTGFDMVNYFVGRWEATSAGFRVVDCDVTLIGPGDDEVAAQVSAALHEIAVSDEVTATVNGNRATFAVDGFDAKVAASRIVEAGGAP